MVSRFEDKGSHSVRSWTPLDFIIEGQYCDIDSIQKTLELIGAASGGASAVILVAHCNERVFASLLRSWVLEKANSDIISELLAGISTSQWIPRTSLPLVTTTLTLALENIEEALKRRLLNVFQDAPAHLLTRVPYPASGPNSQFSAGVSVLIIGGIEAEKPNLEPVSVLLQKLLQQVNAYVAVAIWRESRISHAFNEAERNGDIEHRKDLDEQPPTESRSRYERFAKSLLSVAKELTHSTFGKTFRLSRISQGLGEVGDGRAFEDPQDGSLCTEASINSDVDRAIRKRQPYILGTEDSHVRKDGKDLPVFRLVFPYLQWVTGSDEVEIVGMLYLERSDMAYTAHDLEAAREGAVHYRLTREVSRLHELTRLLDELTRRRDNWLSVETPTPSIKRSEARRVHFVEIWSYDRMIPLEAEQVIEPIEMALQKLHQLTRARLVHLRLLSLREPKLFRFGWISALKNKDGEDVDPWQRYDCMDLNEMKNTQQSACSHCSGRTGNPRSKCE